MAKQVLRHSFLRATLVFCERIFFTKALVFASLRLLQVLQGNDEHGFFQQRGLLDALLELTEQLRRHARPGVRSLNAMDRSPLNVL